MLDLKPAKIKTRRSLNSDLLELGIDVYFQGKWNDKVKSGIYGQTRGSKTIYQMYDLDELQILADEAYKRSMHRFHPDRADEYHREEFEEKTKKINQAYDHACRIIEGKRSGSW